VGDVTGGWWMAGNLGPGVVCRIEGIRDYTKEL
jgi:hypothetical protein